MKVDEVVTMLQMMLDADLVQHKGDRSAAKEAIAKATAIHGKDAAASAKTKADLDTNIAALAKAIPAIEKGMGGFLQTSVAQVVSPFRLTNPHSRATSLTSSRLGQCVTRSSARTPETH